MLTTDKRSALLQNINLRIQKHGAERVLAADLKFEFQVPAQDIDLISPGLKETLFRPPGSGEQMELAQDAATAYTVVRNPGIEPVRLKDKFPGYELTMHADVPEGISGKMLFLVDIELKKISVEPHEGGMATIILTASTPVDSGEIAEASEFLEEGDVLLTLTPPKAQAQQPKPGVDLEPEVASDAISTADAAAAAIAADEAGKALH